MRNLAKAAPTLAATPMDLGTSDASESWVQAEGLQIRFLHAGTGPALVLVHGLLGYSFNWRRVIPILATERRIIVPDMVGAGFSECRRDLDFSLLGSAKRLLAFLDAAGISCCDLVGSSYGGSTALMMAAISRSRVRSLTLVAPANPWSQIGRKRVLYCKIRWWRLYFRSWHEASDPFTVIGCAGCGAIPKGSALKRWRVMLVHCVGLVFLNMPSTLFAPGKRI